MKNTILGLTMTMALAGVSLFAQASAPAAAKAPASTSKMAASSPATPQSSATATKSTKKGVKKHAGASHAKSTGKTVAVTPSK